MKIIATFCILFLLYCNYGVAQTQELKFNLVNGANGIFIGKITGMTRDRHGVMWFSDQSNLCLVRYESFVIYKGKNIQQFTFQKFPS